MADPLACWHIPGLRVHGAPKCASDGVTRAMQGLPGHSRERVDDPGPEYRFGIVRHPLSRLVSGWAFFCKDGRLHNQPTLRQIGYAAHMPFWRFLEVSLANHWRNQHTRQQVDFIGSQPFDRIVRLENLTKEWARLREKFPDLRDIGLQNTSTHGEWEQYYTNKRLKRRAETIYAADMALYEAAEGD